MTSQTFYIFALITFQFSNVYAVYWNETELLTVRRMDARNLGHKLLTFDTMDSQVDLAFQFNVPFVALPTDRSLGNVKNSISAEIFEPIWMKMERYNVAHPKSVFSPTQVSLVNLNLGSIALAGVMVLFGSLTSFLWTLLFPKLKQSSNDNETTEPTDSLDSTTNLDDNTNSTDQIPKSERAYKSNDFLNLIHLFDSSINPTVCVQQYICTLSKNSAINLADGCATSSDKIIAGIFEARWILDMITATSVHDAIQAGVSMGDCQKQFSQCGFESVNLEDLFQMFKLV